MPAHKLPDQRVLQHASHGLLYAFGCETRREEFRPIDLDFVNDLYLWRNWGEGERTGVGSGKGKGEGKVRERRKEKGR